jgi:hypothetical protein
MSKGFLDGRRRVSMGQFDLEMSFHAPNMIGFPDSAALLPPMPPQPND